MTKLVIVYFQYGFSKSKLPLFEDYNFREFSKVDENGVKYDINSMYTNSQVNKWDS